MKSSLHAYIFSISLCSLIIKSLATSIVGIITPCTHNSDISFRHTSFKAFSISTDKNSLQIFSIRFHPLNMDTINLPYSTQNRLTGVGEYLYGEGLLRRKGDGLRLLALRNALSILASMTGEGERPYREL